MNSHLDPQNSHLEPQYSHLDFEDDYDGEYFL